MFNITTFVMVVGAVSMIWRIALKYDLVNGLLKMFKWSSEICVMCVTFWVCFAIFLIVDSEIGLGLNFLRAISATPFVIELTRKEWN